MDSLRGGGVLGLSTADMFLMTSLNSLIVISFSAFSARQRETCTQPQPGLTVHTNARYKAVRLCGINKRYSFKHCPVFAVSFTHMPHLALQILIPPFKPLVASEKPNIHNGKKKRTKSQLTRDSVAISAWQGTAVLLTRF